METVEQLIHRLIESQPVKINPEPTTPLKKIFTVKEREDALYEVFFRHVKSDDTSFDSDWNNTVILGLILVADSMAPDAGIYKKICHHLSVLESAQHLRNKNPNLSADIILPEAESRTRRVERHVDEGTWPGFGYDRDDWNGERWVNKKEEEDLADWVRLKRCHLNLERK